MKRFVLKNRRDWIYCAVMLVVCVALCFLPEYSYTELWGRYHANACAC